MNRVGKKGDSTERRHYINIQTVTRVRNGKGGSDKTWSDGINTWAAIYPMSADQVGKYRSIGVEANFFIKINGLDTVSEENRIRFGTRHFEILSVEDMQERRFTKLIVCKEFR